MFLIPGICNFRWHRSKLCWLFHKKGRIAIVAPGFAQWVHQRHCVAVCGVFKNHLPVLQFGMHKDWIYCTKEDKTSQLHAARRALNKSLTIPLPRFGAEPCQLSDS